MEISSDKAMYQMLKERVRQFRIFFLNNRSDEKFIKNEYLGELLGRGLQCDELKSFF